MTHAETIAKISTLIRLDEVAEAAYARALWKMPDRHVSERLARMRWDHANHAAQFREVLETLGAAVVPRSGEFESFTAGVLRGVDRACRPAEVLARTRQAEAAVLVQYADAAETPLPLQVKRLVRRHLERDEAHLDAIDELRDQASGQ